MGDASSLVAIVGATGTGKSDLSLELAQALAEHGRAAEIVNADAMQLYRGMDVGTAKLPPAGRRGIPHHLLDVLDVTDEASVAGYQTDARSAIESIQARGAVPILVGGSGLYVSSVLFDFRFPGTDAATRARLEEELAKHGPGLLHRRLRAVDPVAAGAIGPHNGRRLVRALEVIELTGEPFGAGLPDDRDLWRPVVILGVRAPRAELVARLDERVEGMWRAGLLDEVRELLPLGLERGVTASRAIGYAQAIAELNGEVSESEAIASTAALTRKYARRQVGWFNRYPQTAWLDHDDPDRVARALALTLPYA
ncbi:MAG TPA: tRNA (adenosine(37)-N6)-dimethylallyltransferase MiaA [Terrimesophilobacter sp.]|uniref:tRNA (adenosine(37)-N6)-dimethylallyltransferase MiaA n=1 Tax=Terrimesophilobacter sp. TaxID=2906435 RepID=UPI002F938B47